MNIKNSERKEKSMADIFVEVGAEELEKALMNAYFKSRGKIAVPGFRKGKAPRKTIERMYGSSVFHSDALDLLAPQAIDLIAAETDLRIVGFPRVTDVDFKDENAGLDITVSVAVYPEVTVGEYKGLSAVKTQPEAADSEIDSEIAGMRLRNARIEKAERPAVNGDIAVIDFEGFLEGEPFEGGKDENYELELGSNSFIHGFEEKLQGMSAGEEREIDLVFPDNYAEHLAGKPVVFKVKLNEVKEKILPDLDDEFAKDVSEFDTLDEYKADIRARLVAARQEEADVAFENALMDKLIEPLDFDIPDVMVEEQMEIAMNNFAAQVSAHGMDPSTYLRIMNISPEDFRENSRVTSERQVRIMLALEKIAELEGIEVSGEDIEKEYESGAEQYKMEIDKLKESVSEEVITRDVKIRRAAQLVTDSATAEEPAPEGSAEAAAPVVKVKKPSSGKAAAKRNPEAGEATAEGEGPAKKPSTRKPKSDNTAKPAEAQDAPEGQPKPKKAAAKPEGDK